MIEELALVLKTGESSLPSILACRQLVTFLRTKSIRIEIQNKNVQVGDELLIYKKRNLWKYSRYQEVYDKEEEEYYEEGYECVHWSLE